MSAPRRHEEDALSAEIVEILERRADRVSKDALQDEEREQRWIARFLVDEELFAFPLERVRAVLPLKGVTPVPLSQPPFIGIAQYQGEIISVASLSAVLGRPGWRITPQIMLVVDIGRGRLVGFDCEEVPRAIQLPFSAIEAARAADDGPAVDVLSPDHLRVKLIDDVGALLEIARGGDHAG